MTEPTFRLDPQPGAMAPSHLTAPEAFTTADRTERNRTPPTSRSPPASGNAPPAARRSTAFR